MYGASHQVRVSQYEITLTEEPLLALKELGIGERFSEAYAKLSLK